MIDKVSKQEIKKLKKQKQYEEIYSRFGSEIYVKVTPEKYLKKQIKQLIKKGEYEIVKEKFGKKRYRKFFALICRDKVYKTTGSKLKATGAYIGAMLPKFMAYALSGSLMVTGVFYGLNREMYLESAVKNQETIEKYNQDLEEYAAYVKSLNLTQKEIIVKVMSDIYANYKYKFSPNEVFGYGRLSLYQYGYGVCRNISDDFCAKLNAIDPSFNAHNIVCYINTHNQNGEEISYDLMDNINREVDVSAEADVANSDGLDSKNIGNHMVAVITMKDETVPMVVDPTNPGMGAIYNGQIYMFNAPENAVEARPVSTFLITEQPLSVISDYFESLENRNSFAEQMKKYCPEALEQTLEDVRKKEAKQEKSFEMKYKVNIGHDSAMKKTSQKQKTNGSKEIEL